MIDVLLLIRMYNLCIFFLLMIVLYTSLYYHIIAFKINHFSTSVGYIYEYFILINIIIKGMADDARLSMYRDSK